MDKNSTTYFMTKMTQKEFTKKQKGHEIIKNYEFNRIRPARLNEKPTKEMNL